MTAPRCYQRHYGCPRLALDAVWAGPLFGPVPMCAIHLERYARALAQLYETRTGDPEHRDTYLATCQALNLPPRPWWN